jgi:phosphoglycerate dehydrogenase-like enzyme
MKLVLASRTNEQFFHLLDDLEGVQVVRAFTEADVQREIVDADAIYGWPSPEAFRLARRLRWIQCPSAGVERLLTFPELVESNVIVTNARGAHAPNMAEHVFAMVLAWSRGILLARDLQRQRRWEGALVRRHSIELAGGTLGIIGLGNIGRAVARRAHAFEMQVLAVDAEPVEKGPFVSELRGLDGLPELLRRSDVVVVSAPHTRQSYHMIGAEQLALMKPTAALVVISRGALVDHAALAAALQHGTIAFAALDATEPEPLPSDSPLWRLENCLITPHSSGHSLQKERRTIEILRENARRFVVGEPLINVIDKKRGY